MNTRSVNPDPDAVRNHRVMNGWTQEQLAEKVGCTSRTIERLESGAAVSLRTLSDIADALGTTISSLVLSKKHALILNAPLYSQTSVLEVAGKKVLVRPLMPIVWLSLTPRGVTPLPQFSRFPAVIDIASNGSLILSKEHVTEWGGYNIASFHYLSPIRVSQLDGKTQSVPMYDADIWIHSNTGHAPPFHIETARGFVLHERGPRLPLLGSLALRAGGMQLEVDYYSLTYSIISRK